MKGDLSDEDYQWVCDVFHRHMFTIFEKTINRTNRNLSISPEFWEEVYRRHTKNNSIYGRLAEVIIELPLMTITFGGYGQTLWREDQTVPGEWVHLNNIEIKYKNNGI